MAVNQKNTTIASFNYLMEVSAIPLETRNTFLEKLLKRKNASVQKNVNLLKCIYNYVNENRISEWDTDIICRQTGITMNALYIQKSRLLKNLREYYFNWKKTVCEIKEKSEQEQRNCSIFKEDEAEIMLMLEKARKMAEIGMTREAKIMYMKIEKKTRLSGIQQIELYLILSEIYDYQSYYYFNKRHKRKLLFFIGKLNKVIDTIKTQNIKITDRQKALLEIRLNFIKFHHYCIEWYKNPKAKMPGNFLERICSLSKKFDYFEYLIKAFHGRIIIELVNENYEMAKDLCSEGFKISGKHNHAYAKHTFASMMYYIKTKSVSNNIKFNNNNILNYYYKIKKINPFNIWTIYLENSIAMMYSPENRKEILEIFREQVISNIMLGDFAFSVYMKFVLDSELYDEKFLSFFNIYNIEFKGYLEMKKIDEKILDDIKKICLNTECYHTKINDFGLSWLVHKLKLITYYFREDGYDYNEVTDLLKTMKQLTKKSKIKSGLKTYELLKLGLKMLDNSDDKKNMLSKYELKFKKTIEDFKNSPQDFTITDYATVSSLSRRLKCKEITAIVKGVYGWLCKEHPDILAPVFREIKEHESKIYTVTGGAA